MIEIIKDIDLINEYEKYDVILVGVNLYHTMGNGFQRKVRIKVPETYELDISTNYGDKNKIGTIVNTNTTPIFILCYIVKGYNFRPDINKDFLDYDALEKCLKIVNSRYKGKRVACPILGSSRFDGNGDKDRIMKIFDNSTNELNLFLYDYRQLSVKEDESNKYNSIVKNKEYDREKKTQLFNAIKNEDTPNENHVKRMKRIKKEIKDLLNKGK